MRVLVLDGNENQAVAAVRSLAGAGYRVEAGASSAWSKAGWSRSCAATFRYPAPESDADAFVNCIAGRAETEPGTFVLPMTERTTLALSVRREKISAAGGLMAMPPHATILRAFDKHQMTTLASSLGIATPKSSLVTDPVQAREVANSFNYPAVLKPRSSEQDSSSGGINATGRPMYARNAPEFLALYVRLRERCSQVLAQEFVQGAGAGYFALMRNGELRAEFAHRRLRDVRPTGSGSSLRLSVEPAPEMRAAALALLQELRWHGVAMVEFRVKPDGKPVFLEINGRFWNSLALAVYAGAGFPAWLVQMTERGDIATPSPYRVGVRCRWLLGDFRHLVEVLWGAPAGYPARFPSRLRTLISFLTPVRGTFHDNFEWRDPLPAVGDWLHFALHRMPEVVHTPSALRAEHDV